MAKILLILFLLLITVVSINEDKFIETRKAIAISKSFIINKLDSKYDLNNNHNFNRYLHTHSKTVEISYKILDKVTIQKRNYSLYVYPYLISPAENEIEAGINFTIKF